MTSKSDAFPDATLRANARIIARSTFRYADSADVVIRYHATDIIRLHPDGSATLNSGGWRWPTTKARLNDFSPARISQNKGFWYIDGHCFFDGIQVSAAGKVLNPDNGAEARAKAGAKAVSNFVRLLDATQEIPLPYSGDCWHCLMFSPIKAVTSKTREQWRHCPAEVSDTAHIRSHVEEQYLHGSLIVNAMRWRGYTDEAIGFYYRMPADKSRRAFKQAIRLFLKKVYGLA
jgi:hypothetical protein